MGERRFIPDGRIFLDARILRCNAVHGSQTNPWKELETSEGTCAMQDILSQTATFVLAGGRGKRLLPLTLHRWKPALPFGDGSIIDFTLAKCLRLGATN